MRAAVTELAVIIGWIPLLMAGALEEGLQDSATGGVPAAARETLKAAGTLAAEKQTAAATSSPNYHSGDLLEDERRQRLHELVESRRRKVGKKRRSGSRGPSKVVVFAVMSAAAVLLLVTACASHIFRARAPSRSVGYALQVSSDDSEQDKFWDTFGKETVPTRRLAAGGSGGKKSQSSKDKKHISDGDACRAGQLNLPSPYEMWHAASVSYEVAENKLNIARRTVVLLASRLKSRARVPAVTALRKELAKQSPNNPVFSSLAAVLEATLKSPDTPSQPGEDSTYAAAAVPSTSSLPSTSSAMPRLSPTPSLGKTPSFKESPVRQFVGIAMVNFLTMIEEFETQNPFVDIANQAVGLDNVFEFHPVTGERSGDPTPSWKPDQVLATLETVIQSSPLILEKMRARMQRVRKELDTALSVGLSAKGQTWLVPMPVVWDLIVMESTANLALEQLNEQPQPMPILQSHPEEAARFGGANAGAVSSAWDYRAATAFNIMGLTWNSQERVDIEIHEILTSLRESVKELKNASLESLMWHRRLKEIEDANRAREPAKWVADLRQHIKHERNRTGDTSDRAYFEREIQRTLDLRSGGDRTDGVSPPVLRRRGRSHMRKMLVSTLVSNSSTDDSPRNDDSSNQSGNVSEDGSAGEDSLASEMEAMMLNDPSESKDSTDADRP